MIVEFGRVMQAVKFIAECESFPFNGDVIMAMHPIGYECSESAVEVDCVLSKAVELGYVETFPSAHDCPRYRLTPDGERLYLAIKYGERQ